MKRKIFITSDHHFYHKNIIRYCDRPFNSYQEMNETMIKKWNKKVGKNDIVIHLGDFCLFGEEKARLIRKQLNGVIILVSGNHDYRNMEDIGFIVVKGNLQIGNLILSHRPLQKDEIPKGFINVHGHIHLKNSYYGINICVEKTNYYPILLENVGVNVSVEKTDYEPIELCEVMRNGK